MADFFVADSIVVKHEGGFTKEPDDNGNWTGGKKGVGLLIGTNHGISAPLLTQYLGRLPKYAEMLNLSKETAQKIRKKFFWDVMWGDKLKHQKLANELYDNGINVGVAEAVRMMADTVGAISTGKMNHELLNKLNA